MCTCVQEHMLQLYVLVGEVKKTDRTNGTGSNSTPVSPRDPGVKQLMVMGHYCIVRIKKVEARSTRDKVHRDLTLSPTFPL
jgi:hypothetical protein